MARMKFICDTERCIECNGCVTACKNDNEVPWGVNRRRVVTVNDGIIGNLALNYDRSESNNSLMEKEAIIESFASQGIKNCNFSTIQDGQSKSPIAIDKPAKFWRILLLLSLLFILFEIALLKFWK
jgi:ferredoxin